MRKEREDKRNDIKVCLIPCFTASIFYVPIIIFKFQIFLGTKKDEVKRARYLQVKIVFTKY